MSEYSYCVTIQTLRHRIDCTRDTVERNHGHQASSRSGAGQVCCRTAPSPHRESDTLLDGVVPRVVLRNIKTYGLSFDYSPAYHVSGRRDSS
jgi:hypothetical protein